MDRRTFVKHTCIACIGTIAGASLLDSCTTVHHINGTMDGNRLTAPLAEFTRSDSKGNKTMRPYIIVKHDSLKYPICVFRASETEYKSLWMSCPHQGAELQVLGDTLVCQAHGSEFDNKGRVTSGPADKDLRTFKTYADGQLIHIVLL